MFHFDDDKYYSMPPFFGGRPARKKFTFDECRSFSVAVLTEQKALEAFIPEDFALISPEIIYTFWQGSRCSWFDGSCNCLSVNVTVQYLGNDEGLTGLLPLLIWANSVPLAQAGREEAGIPAVYTEIADPKEDRDGLSAAIGVPSCPFVTVRFQETEPLFEQDIHQMNEEAPARHFGWKYIPNTGAPGAALSHATMIPFRSVISSGWRGQGSVAWHRDAFAHYSEYGHILSSLANLPVLGSSEGRSTVSMVSLMLELARPLP